MRRVDFCASLFHLAIALLPQTLNQTHAVMPEAERAQATGHVRTIVKPLPSMTAPSNVDALAAACVRFLSGVRARICVRWAAVVEREEG